MSRAFDRARERYRMCRGDYDLVILAMYERAEDDTRGALLNERGREAGIEPMSLFMGPRVRVDAYASEELREWFDANGRVTFDDFERQWLDAHDKAAAA